MFWRSPGGMAIRFQVRSRIEPGDERMHRTIRTGDIYWLLPDPSQDAEPGVLHPHVVIRADVWSDREQPAVVACALTTNLRRVSLPGNLLIPAGEANLPKTSIVEVSKVVTLETARLGVFIGRLSEQRVAQIQAGIRFVATSFRPR